MPVFWASPALPALNASCVETSLLPGALLLYRQPTPYSLAPP
jgi:hypothetical protein